MLAPYLAVGAVIAGAVLLQMANGLIGLLLPIRLDAEGYSSTAVGVVAAAYGAGFVLGCVRAPYLIRAVGHIRAFAVLASLSAVTALIFLTTTGAVLWTVLRLIMGFTLAGLFSVVEAWLSAATPDVSRGRVLGVYLVGTKLSTIAGQWLVGIGQLGAAALFVVASGVFSLALVPVALSQTPAPSVPRLVGLHLGEMWRIAPAAVAGCVGAGLLSTPVAGLVPIWAIDLGLPVSLVVVLLNALLIGSLLVQWPLGWLSDRIDRRHVIVGCLLGVAATSIVIAAFGHARPLWLIALFAVWGAFSMSFYGICVAHAGDHAQPEEMVRVTSSALLAWASGSTIGPLLAAPLLDLFGAAGLFLYAAIVSGGIAGFVAWRTTRRAAVPVAARDAFVNIPATSPTLAEMHPRNPRPSPAQ